MAMVSLESLGREVARKRDKQGIRAAAKEIGISAATLSRIENGHLPDLETLQKVCRWLNIDPLELAGISQKKASRPAVAVHFRKDQTLALETATALAEMILAAQRAILIQEEQ